MNDFDYGEYLRHDPTFKEEAKKAREMIESDDNSDRIPADEFEEWARQQLGQGRTA